jgi:hypothetical protein
MAVCGNIDIPDVYPDSIPGSDLLGVGWFGGRRRVSIKVLPVKTRGYTQKWDEMGPRLGINMPASVSIRVS